MIDEPAPFCTKWYSKKHNGPGLRYEVCVSIKLGNIVAYNGPFPCGSNPDITIFRKILKGKLMPGERVIADRGYRGDSKTFTPDQFTSTQHKRAMSLIRARHETLNGILKN